MAKMLDTVTVTDPVVLEFSRRGIASNFNHNYQFELAAPFYLNTTFTTDRGICIKGCGNPLVQYRWYDSKGNTLQDTSVVLSSGRYGLGVTGTGMGSGNNLAYSATATFVSAVPEPGDVALMGVSLVLLGLGVKLNKFFKR